MAPDAEGTMRKSRRMPFWSPAGRWRASETAAVARGGARPRGRRVRHQRGLRPRRRGPPIRDPAGVDRRRSIGAPGATLSRLAQAVAAELRIPYVDLLTRTEARPPQREMANAVQQAAKVRGASPSPPPRPGGPASSSTTAGAPAGHSRWSGGGSERREASGSFRSCSTL